MDKVLRKSLLDALSWASLKDLPEKWDGENIYILALGLAAKMDGSKSYVALKKDEKGNDKVVKDFGSVSIISRIDAVYPYLYLDGSFIPSFGGQKKEDRINWLEQMNYGTNGAYEGMSLKELNKEVLNTAIRNQLNAIK